MRTAASAFPSLENSSQPSDLSPFLPVDSTVSLPAGRVGSSIYVVFAGRVSSVTDLLLTLIPLGTPRISARR